jgi:acetyl-CoA carboxylase biotin carboxyl carrier protein
MNLDEIKRIIEALSDTDVTEFELETGKTKIRIRRGRDEADNEPRPPYVVVTSSGPAGLSGAPGAAALDPASVAAQASAAQAAAPAVESDSEDGEDENLIVVTSPIVGTFYESSAPGAPSFVEVGDRVKVGQVLCIIEAMKLMNEIEADSGGVLVKRFVENSQPVEYGEALFAIKPD